jgi:hypothetical protein
MRWMYVVKDEMDVPKMQTLQSGAFIEMRAMR